MLPNLQAVGCEAAVAGLYGNIISLKSGPVERHAEQGGCGRQGRRRRRLRDLVPSVAAAPVYAKMSESTRQSRAACSSRSRARRANCGPRRPRACARQYGGLRGGGSPADLAPQCSPGASEAPPKNAGFATFFGQVVCVRQVQHRRGAWDGVAARDLRDAHLQGLQGEGGGGLPTGVERVPSCVDDVAAAWGGTGGGWRAVAR